MNADQTLRCRVPKPIKDRFEALAGQRGETPSALLRLLLDQTIEAAGDEPDSSVAKTAATSARSDRMTVRLRPGDGALLRSRARTRGVKAATYLALLVRRHLRGAAPLPEGELREVKRALSELSAIARGLRQSASSGDATAAIQPNALQDVLDRVEGARGAIAQLVRANIDSWDSGDA